MDGISLDNDWLSENICRKILNNEKNYLNFDTDDILLLFFKVQSLIV
jgi:hypothetical protein